MSCPLCGARRAKRACPALGQQICPVCCGTKRLVEIRCPPECPYLATARDHPPAVVQRRQVRDARALWPMVQGLSEGAYRMFVFLQTVLQRSRPASMPPLRDQDVAEAAGALAATLETADRGIIFEHRPTSLASQRVVGDLKAAMDDLARASEGRPPSTRDSAAALRAIEGASKSAGASLGEGDTAYLDLVERFLMDIGAASEQGGRESSAEAPRLIIPG